MNKKTAKNIVSNTRKVRKETRRSSTIDIDLFSSFALLRVITHKWGNRRKIKGTGSSKASERLRKIKTLIKCPELDLISDYLNKIFSDTPSSWINRYTEPSNILDGVRLVKTSEVPRVERKLRRMNRVFAEVLIPKLIRAYPAAKLTAKADFDEIAKEIGAASEYCESDYPAAAQLALKYGIEWSWFTIGVPKNLPSQVRHEEERKLKESFEKARLESIAAARAMFQEIVARATERLTVKEGEQEKIFRDTLIDNFNSFCQTFQYRNIYKDSDLEGLINRANNLIKGVRPETLREDPDTRASVAKSLKVVKKQIDTLVTEAPSRRFEFED